MKYSFHYTKINYFSVIELMVVIAMMALLASLLSPSLKKITSESQTLVCKSKLSTLSNVSALYLDDYEQAYYFVAEPYNINWNTKSWQTKRWYILLQDLYLKPYDESFECPKSEIPYNSETRRVSYGYNLSTMGNYWVWAWYVMKDDMSRAHQTRTLSHQILNPSKQVVKGDMNRSSVSYWRHDLLNYFREDAIEDISPMARHTAYSSNFNFADGHVENLFYDDVAPQSKKPVYWELTEK